MARNSTLGDNITPRDAVIDTSSGDVTIDLATWVVGTFRNQWDSSNTDDEFPNIEFAEYVKTADFRSNDWIQIWGLADTSDPVTTPYLFTNEQVPIQLDLITSKGRVHAKKMRAEVRRIVEGNRRDSFSNTGSNDTNGVDNLTGRLWLEWTRANPFDQASTGIWRRQIDLTLHWRFRRTTS